MTDRWDNMNELKIHKLVVGAIDTNCYIVESPDGEVAVIDPGDESAKIIEELEKIKNLHLRYILLTHGHFDHVLAVDDLKIKYPRADIMIHENDIYLLKNLKAQRFFVGEIYHKVESEIMAISDGSELPFFNVNIKTIATPGHTPGEVCYLLVKNLFSGDTLFYHAYGRTDLPGGDFEIMKESLRKIILLPEDIKVYPGHGRETSIKEEKNYFTK